jgi:hypothetical protein
MRLVDDAKMQVDEALAAREQLRYAGTMTERDEAETDVRESVRRWDLAREDLAVLTGDCQDPFAIARATADDYPGQVMAYPPAEHGGYRGTGNGGSAR